MTQNELANIIGIKDSSMSVRLNKLEKNGYIVREIDDENLKKKKIYITQSGKIASTQCRRILREIDEQLWNGFTKKEIKEMKKYFDKMQKNMCGE